MADGKSAARFSLQSVEPRSVQKAISYQFLYILARHAEDPKTELGRAVSGGREVRRESPQSYFAPSATILDLRLDCNRVITICAIRRIRS